MKRTGIAILTDIYLFFIEDKEGCRVCGRPEYLDCIEDELCGRIDRFTRNEEGDCLGLLVEVVESKHLSDAKGDASGGHLLADARAYLRMNGMKYTV